MEPPLPHFVHELDRKGATRRSRPLRTALVFLSFAALAGLAALHFSGAL